MTAQNQQFRWIFLFLFLALAVVSIEWIIVHSAAFTKKPDLLSLGITLDLVLGLPVLYYFLVIKKARISRATLLVILVLSGLLATAVLPNQYHRYLTHWEKLIMLAEIGVFAMVLIKARTVFCQFKNLQRQTVDFIANLQLSLAPAVGSHRLSSLLVSEISVFRYSLFGWLGSVEKTVRQQAFTMHQESAQVAMVGALLLVGLIETTLLHLLIVRWSPIAAFVGTLIGAYGLLFFVADTVALVKRPILIDGNVVQLRFGLRWQVACPVANIEQFVIITENPIKASDTLVGSFLTSPNIMLTFREPMPVEGIYGIQRSVRCIAFFVDQRDEFIESVRQCQSIA